ncbi:hypothetical protein H4R24_004472 [Coemansia sp. RSA 988]|nr:hypothetical protein H4R24_004472 [Coemansia sp. RSA 988]
MASPSEMDYVSDMEDEEDEVFFGPMTTVELKKLHKFRDIHRRSTQVMQLTPLEDRDKNPDTVVQGAAKIQALFRGALVRKHKKTTDTIAIGHQCATPEASPMPLSAQQQERERQVIAVVNLQRLSRGFLARRMYGRRREELRFLAVKGSISVERRRRIPRPQTMRALPDIPQTLQSAPASATNGFSQQRAVLSPPQAPLPLLPRDTPPRSPLRRGLSIRNWFQRQQHVSPDSAPPLSNSRPERLVLSPSDDVPARTKPLKVNSILTARAPMFLSPFRRSPSAVRHSDSVHTANASGSRARRYLGRFLAQLRPMLNTAAPPTADAEQPTRSVSSTGAAELVLHRRSNSRSAARCAVLPKHLHGRRHRHHYQRCRRTIVGTPAARRQRRGAGSSSCQSIDCLAQSPPPPMPLSLQYPTNNTTTNYSTSLASPEHTDTSALYESHILLVPLESTSSDTPPPMSQNNFQQKQQPFSGNVRRLRSPPPIQQPALMQGVGSGLPESEAPQNGASHKSGIGKPAGSGTKLSMLKSGLGSFLANPLSPRVSSTRSFQSHIPRPGTRGDPAIRSEPVVRAKAPAPMPVRRDKPTSLSLQRSDTELNSTATPVDVVYADMPLSAVGGSNLGSTMRTIGSDTDEETGIAASVARIASPADVPLSSTSFACAEDMPDDASVTSISSMSVSSLLESPVSPVSIISTKPMDISPPLTNSRNSCVSINISRLTSRQSSDPEPSREVLFTAPIQKPKLDLSPRLSLRLSADAATFGTGLSVFASLLDDVRQHSTQDSAVDASLASMATAPVENTKDYIMHNADTGQYGNDQMPSVENAVQVPAQLPVVTECGPSEVAFESSAMDCEPPPPTESDSPATETVRPAEESEPPAALPGSPASMQTQSEMAPEDTEQTNPAMERLRSLRTRRQREKGESTPKAAAPTPATRRFRATQKAAAGSNAGTKDRPLAQMGALQLDRLTKLNTRRNATYMTCQIERVVEVREGDRPPSPSLMMQLRAQERRLLSGNHDAHSIYSTDSESSDENNDAMSLCSNVCSDAEMNEDTRPLSPEPTDVLDSTTIPDYAPLSAAELPTMMHDSLPETKRKSAELPLSASLPLLNTLAESDDTSFADGKKQCRRSNRIRWGTRSVLQASWLLGHDPGSLRMAPSSIAARNSKAGGSILVRKTTESSPQTVDISPGNAKGKRQSKNLDVIKVSCIEYPHSTTDALLGIEDSDSEEDEMSSPDTIDDDEEYIPRRSTRSSTAASFDRKQKSP